MSQPFPLQSKTPHKVILPLLRQEAPMLCSTHSYHFNTQAWEGGRAVPEFPLLYQTSAACTYPEHSKVGHSTLEPGEANVTDRIYP